MNSEKQNNHAFASNVNRLGNMRTMILCVLFTCLASCKEKEDVRLNFALEQAGANRAELERVLHHYRNDSLKLEAARFLIRNMPGHGGYEDCRLDSVKAVMKASVDANIGGYLPDSEWKRKWLSFDYKSLSIQLDIKCISAGYLIENIDQSFKVWEECPWSKDYSFDDFCEWILPYRIADEPLENWKKEYYDRYKPLLDSLYTGDDMVEAVNLLARHFKRTNLFVLTTEYCMPHLGAGFLSEYLVGTCREITDHAVYVFRALGFPVGIDKYLYSPSNQHDHVWNVLKDSDGGFIPFWYMDSSDFVVKRGVTDGRKKGKVYRNTFAAHYGRTAPLSGLFSRDVTAEYFGENEFKVKVDKKGEDNTVLLGMFTPFKYVPVDVAPLRFGKARVNNIEPGVIFQPLVYEDGKQKPAGYPFMVENGEVRYFRPHVSQTTTARIRRKYPLRQYLYGYMAAMTGARIEASNDKYFRNKELLYCITDSPRIHMNLYYPSVPRPYRYVRFTPPPQAHPTDDWRAEVAELAFFDSIDSQAHLTAKAVYGGAPVDGNPAYGIDKACDGDWLTFYYSAAGGDSIVFDLQRAGVIKKILFVPRNDDNFITPGNRYELVYQNGVNGWKTLGEQVAATNELVYENIPVGALLWLRNLTRGKEEQVFYVENGEQKFVGYE
ncbi:hypothetical protein [Bacteroides sp. UBA939]|uniref:hypothetical protein n=1 Tax=Bacteroides sp. UBA939 TaxID=1946092 RepID=UPI0025BD041A|nr:hypothetical protein [Bacteroides sp. UBA939]